MTATITVLLPTDLADDDREAVEKHLAASGLPIWLDDLSPRNSAAESVWALVTKIPEAALGGVVSIALEQLLAAAVRAIRGYRRDRSTKVVSAVIQVNLQDGREIGVLFPEESLFDLTPATVSAVGAELHRLARDRSASGTYEWDGAGRSVHRGNVRGRRPSSR